MSSPRSITAPPPSSVKGEHVESFETVSPRRCEQPPGLVRRERVYLLRRGRGGLERTGGVTGDEVDRFVSGSLSANFNTYRCSTGSLRVIKDADMVLTTFGVGDYTE
jgi:hypothetical protein